MSFWRSRREASSWERELGAAREEEGRGEDCIGNIVFEGGI